MVFNIANEQTIFELIIYKMTNPLREVKLGIFEITINMTLPATANLLKKFMSFLVNYQNSIVCRIRYY